MESVEAQFANAGASCRYVSRIEGYKVSNTIPLPIDMDLLTKIQFPQAKYIWISIYVGKSQPCAVYVHWLVMFSCIDLCVADANDVVRWIDAFRTIKPYNRLMLQNILIYPRIVVGNSLDIQPYTPDNDWMFILKGNNYYMINKFNFILIPLYLLDEFIHKVEMYNAAPFKRVITSNSRWCIFSTPDEIAHPDLMQLPILPLCDDEIAGEMAKQLSIPFNPPYCQNLVNLAARAIAATGWELKESSFQLPTELHETVRKWIRIHNFCRTIIPDLSAPLFSATT